MSGQDRRLHPSEHARHHPDKLAYAMASTGERVTYGALEAAANRGAQLFRAHGLRRGDTVAICLENSSLYFPVVWAAERAGLYFTCISTRLTTDEVEYIVRDSGAKLLVISAAVTASLEALAERLGDTVLYVAGTERAGYLGYEATCMAMPATPIQDPSPGIDMLYSSGTTGKPKGIKPPLPEGPLGGLGPMDELARDFYGLDQDTVYLSPAPLYHAAPLRWCMAVQRLGGAVVVMERFEPEAALALIETWRVTASQWVPTHFIRMLKLPQADRGRFDLSSMRMAVHAAAPCPPDVKRAMLDWWGPIIHEYYSGTEGNGFTAVSPEEWLSKPGTVGRSLRGVIHICDDEGRPLPAGAEGVVYFAGGSKFAYHNDPLKTAESYNALGWSTLGDVGRLDEDGYLYLTDRKNFMIISGGVNIYPQEIENLLVSHPKVADVAVFGAPDDDMGERVVAVVEPVDWSDATPSLAEELTAFARAGLSSVKTPRVIDFLRELPRHPTGKLYKRLLRDSYWSAAREGPLPSQ